SNTMWGHFVGDAVIDRLFATMPQGRSTIVKRPGVGSLAAHLRPYLQDKRSLFLPEISEIIADVNRFTSSILSDGLQTAISHLENNAGLPPDRPFIEV